MDSECYQIKRCTLIVLCFISIVGCIIIIGMAPTFVDEYIKASGNIYEDGARDNYIVALRLIYAIVMIIQFAGLFGAMRENFCLTCFYTICLVMGTIGNFCNVATAESIHPIDWLIMVISSFACIVAILFLHDFRTKRNTRTTYQSTI